MDGVAVTEEPVEELNENAGDQVYVVAPKAVSVAGCPEQTGPGEKTCICGGGLTVTVTCCEAEHPSEFPVTV